MFRKVRASRWLRVGGIVVVISAVMCGFVAAVVRSHRAHVSVASELHSLLATTPMASKSSTPGPSRASQSPAVKGAHVQRTAQAPAPPATVIYPSQVINLADWKLTLPVKGSGDNALEVEQPALATYASEAYFRKLSDNSGVQLIANAGGATTSGSDYPRTELREMTSGGQSNASWSSTSGTHRLKITASIDHLPAVKPEVVFAQIHAGDDDLVEAQITRMADGNNRLWVHHNGKQYGADLADNYVLGTRFALEIVAHDGFVDVYYNGEQKVHQPLPASDLYFKTGCYTQSNPAHGESPSAYGEVRLYDVSVSHS